MSIRCPFHRLTLASTWMAAIGLTAAGVTAEPPDRAEIFDRIHQIVADEFFDPRTAGCGLAGRPHTIPTAGRQRTDARVLRRASSTRCWRCSTPPIRST